MDLEDSSIETDTVTRGRVWRRLGLLWGSQLFSAIGDQLYLLAIIWTATRLVGSRAGLVLFAQYGATLAVNVLAGGLPDRRDRRVLMVGADLLRAGVVLMLPWFARGSRLGAWELMGAAGLLGALGAVFDPSLQATLPLLATTPTRLHAANTLMESTRRIARVLAPSLAAVLLVRMSMTALFTLDAATFAVSAMAIGSLWHVLRPPPREVSRPLGLRESLAGSWRLALIAPRVGWGLGTLLVGNVVWSIGFVVGTPLWVQRVMSGGSGAYAVLTAVFGLGNVTGLLLAGLRPGVNRLRTMCTGSLLMGAGYLVLASATTEPVAVLGLFIAGAGGPMHSLSLVGMLQNELPRASLGRAYGLYMIAGGLGVAGGSLGASALFGWVRISMGLGLGAALMFSWTALVLVRALKTRSRTPQFS